MLFREGFGRLHLQIIKVSSVDSLLCLHLLRSWSHHEMVVDLRFY